VVNTDAAGLNFRLAQEAESPGPLPALSWIRTGGFAGVCQTSACIPQALTGSGLQGGRDPGQTFCRKRTYILERGIRAVWMFEWKSMPPALGGHVHRPDPVLRNRSQVMPRKSSKC